MIRSRYTAAVTDKPWWLAGGIDPGACVGVYQPIQKSDLYSSKCEYIANKVWLTDNVCKSVSPANGWYNDGTTGTANISTEYFGLLGINTSNLSWALRINPTITASDQHYFSLRYNNTLIRFIIENDTGYVTFQNGESAFSSKTAVVAGTYVCAGSEAYANGALLSAAVPTANLTIFTSHAFNCGYAASYKPVGYFSAWALYKTKITPSQVAELTRAMNAL